MSLDLIKYQKQRGKKLPAKGKQISELVNLPLDCYYNNSNRVNYILV